jgi:putative transposase
MEQENRYAKAKWAKKLGVSTSGYYDWIRSREQRRSREQTLTEKVKSIFDDSNGTYGAERICGVLRSKGQSASYPVVKRIMEQEGLKSVHVRRRQRSLTDSRKARDDRYKNLTTNLDIDSPFQVVSSDISYVRTGEGFDYLCKVRDVYTGAVLAACQTKSMKKELVLQTMEQAQKRWHLPAGTIWHSDRGSQFTAEAVKYKAEKYGWKQSFSRVGKPGDNAWSESFFSILKKEIVHWRFYPTRESARQAIFEYIEVFYNRRRVQKRLGYRSPIEFLKAWQQKHLPAVA